MNQGAKCIACVTFQARSLPVAIFGKLFNSVIFATMDPITELSGPYCV